MIGSDRRLNIGWEDIWQQIKQTILKAVADNVPSKLVGAKQ